MAWKELVKSVIHCLSALSRGLTSQPSGDLALLPCSRPAPLCLHFSSLSLLLQSHCPLAAFQTHQPLAHLRVFALAVPCALHTSLDSHIDPSSFQLCSMSSTFPERPPPNRTLQTQSIYPALFCNVAITTGYIYIFASLLFHPSPPTLDFSSM